MNVIHILLPTKLPVLGHGQHDLPLRSAKNAYWLGLILVAVTFCWSEFHHAVEIRARPASRAVTPSLESFDHRIDWGESRKTEAKAYGAGDSVATARSYWREERGLISFWPRAFLAGWQPLLLSMAVALRVWCFWFDTRSWSHLSRVWRGVNIYFFRIIKYCGTFVANTICIRLQSLYTFVITSWSGLLYSWNWFRARCREENGVPYLHLASSAGLVI